MTLEKIIISYFKIITVTIIGVLFFASCSESKKIYYDKYWRKTFNPKKSEYFRMYSKGKDSLNRKIYITKDFYIDGKLQMDGIYISINSDIKDGKFTWYFKNGKTKEIGFYKNNQRQGEFIQYYESGKIKSSAQYLNDTITNYKEWYEKDSSIYEIVIYKKGRIDGKHLTFYPNGKLIRSELFEDGKFAQGLCFTKSGTDTAYFPQYIKPVFPGGNESLSEYFKKQLALSEPYLCHMRGIFVIKAFVDVDGKLIDPKFNSKDDCLIDVAIKILENSPDWIPGKCDGIIKKQAITVSVPIVF